MPIFKNPVAPKGRPGRGNVAPARPAPQTAAPSRGPMRPENILTKPGPMAPAQSTAPSRGPMRPENILTRPGTGPMDGKPAPSFNPQNTLPSFGDEGQVARLPAFSPQNVFNPELIKPGTGPMGGKPAPSFNPQNTLPGGNPGFGNPMGGKPAPSFNPQNTLPSFGDYGQPVGTTAPPYNPVQALQDYQKLQGGNPGFGNPMQQQQPFGQQQYDQFMQQFNQQQAQFNQQPQQMQNPYISQLQGFQNQPPVQPPMQAQQAFNDFRAGAFPQPQQGAVPSKGLLNPTNVLTAQPLGMGQPQQAQQPQQAPGMGQPQQTQQPQQAPGMGQPQQAKPAGGGGGGIM